jgi:hypothetical protein
MNDNNETDERRHSRRKTIIIAIIALVIFFVGISMTHIGGPKNITPQSAQNESSASSTPSAGPSPSEPSVDLSKYDWSKLKGEKLSNAYKLAKHDGIRTTDLDLEIITSDGKQVLNPANWSISDISFTSPNKLLIHANHDTKGGSTADTLGSVINDTLSKL